MPDPRARWVVEINMWVEQSHVRLLLLLLQGCERLGAIERSEATATSWKTRFERFRFFETLRAFPHFSKMW